MRRRFSNDSLIDVKGCRIGQNISYLGALAHYFGGEAGGIPIVRAPDYFQNFANMGARSHTSSELPGLWSNAAIREAFIFWARASGWPLSNPPAGTDLIAALRAGHAFPVQTTLHYLEGHDPGNVVEWFARFGYGPTAAEIRRNLFQGHDTITGIRGTIVDWLSDRRPTENPTEMLFPPDPRYRGHFQTSR